MDEHDLDSLVQRAVEAFASDKPQAEVLLELGETKRTLTDKAYAINRATLLIDNLAENLKPGTRWDYTRRSWTSQPLPGMTTSNPATVDRAQRVLEIVQSKVAAGAKQINTKEVAEQLRLEGDEKPLSSLATAVGNVLSRTEQWQRIRRNTYVPFAVA